MKIRKLLLLLLLITNLTFCVKTKNSNVTGVTHFTHISEWGERTDFYYLDSLGENDTLLRKVFNLQKVRIKDKEVYVLSTGFPSVGWRCPKRETDLERKNPVKINRYHCTEETLNDLSVVLKNVRKIAQTDSLGYIVISTYDIVETGIQMSVELLNNNIREPSTLSNAVSKTFLKKK